MVQLTVRGVPEDIKRALEQRAKEQGLSVNRVVLGLVCRGLGRRLDGKPHRPRNLERYFGTWTEEKARAFEERLADQSRVEEEG